MPRSASGAWRGARGPSGAIAPRPRPRRASPQAPSPALGVSEGWVGGAGPGGGRGRRRGAARDEAPGATAAAASRPSAPLFERFCLGLLLRDPEILYQIDRRFAGLELDRLG